jgi:hypothetical protein
MVLCRPMYWPIVDKNPELKTKKRDCFKNRNLKKPMHNPPQNSDLEIDRLYLTPSEGRIGIIGRPSIGPFVQRKETGPILKINCQGSRPAIHWKKVKSILNFFVNATIAYSAHSTTSLFNN